MNGLRCVGIIGLGLIGGSLARDLAARGVRVLGFDCDEATRRAARDAGVIDAHDDDYAALAAADALILAVPVDVAPTALEAARPYLDETRLITDVGSTKQSILEAATRLGLAARFVGAHPMAGDHRGGWAAARTGLFEGARVHLCATTDTAAEAMRLAAALWSQLGARPATIDALAHDRLLAQVSHLPQAAASALACVLAGSDVSPAELGPGGRAMLRLAASPAGLWTAIALDNAANLAPALAALENELRVLRAAVAARDQEAVHAFFARAQGHVSPG